MQTIESVYVSICLIGWCVLSVIALVGLLAILVWAFVTDVKDWRKKMASKICAVCGCPYVGASCPNCGSKEVEEDDDG